MNSTISERLGHREREYAFDRTVASRKPSAARERILQAADSLFYELGIRSVGIDRIVSDAAVTKVTFYRHFPSKDCLVESYLRRRGDRLRERVADAYLAEPKDPRLVLARIAESLAQDAEAAEYRGCEFINAAGEAPDDRHPARELGVEQRAWIVDVAAEALEELGHPQPRRLARQLMMLRTGATVLSSLDPDEDTGEVFLDAWQRMLSAELGPAAVVSAGA